MQVAFILNTREGLKRATSGLGLVALASGLVLTTASAPASANASNLLANPGFETGDFSGWTLGGNSAPPALDVYCGGGSLVNDGNCSAYSAAIGTAATIEQTFATVVGQAYQVDYWALFDGSSGSNFTVTFGGETLVNMNNPSGTLNFSRNDLVATSPTTTLKFSMRDDPGFQFLDSVSVAAVPEPASVALMGLGVAAIVWRRRRLPSGTSRAAGMICQVTACASAGGRFGPGNTTSIYDTLAVKHLMPAAVE